MASDDRLTRRDHEHAEHLLSAAATLTGTCLAAVGLLRIEQATLKVTGLSDNIMAASALGFLVATGLCYVALRRRSGRLRLLAEIAFAAGAFLLAGTLLYLIWEGLI